jgi:hypothetical protein
MYSYAVCLLPVSLVMTPLARIDVYGPINPVLTIILMMTLDRAPAYYLHAPLLLPRSKLATRSWKKTDVSLIIH